MKLPGINNRYARYILLLLVITLFAFGTFIGYIGNEAENPLLIVAGFFCMASSFVMFKSWREKGNVRIIPTGGQGKGEVQTEPANSMNLYPGLIKFEYSLVPEGQSQKCFNDGAFYYIQQFNRDENKLEEFKLPDDDEKERYYDPRELVNPVTMPSNKKYFTWSASLMQTIRAGIMALIIAGEIIGLIAMG
jgi:hypothetical protein